MHIYIFIYINLNSKPSQTLHTGPSIHPAGVLNSNGYWKLCWLSSPTTKLESRLFRLT